MHTQTHKAGNTERLEKGTEAGEAGEAGRLPHQKSTLEGNTVVATRHVGTNTVCAQSIFAYAGR
jgi:hypothetical protein